MFIHDLALGTSFEDLLVEVVSCHGVNAKTKAENPVYSATVADATGYVTLIYRTSTNCRPSNVKKGKCYMVSGKVTSHKGHLQIQIGSSWGRVSLVHGESVASKPAYSPATDLSAPERLYACMLLRQQGGGIQVWSYMTHDAAAKPGPGCPFPAVHADYAETGQSAAARAADTLLELKPASFRLFSLPTVAHFTAGTVPKITAAHLAVLNNPSDRFAVGALGGSWTDLASLHERVPPDWAAVVGMARQQLQAAAAAGLADLQFPASGPASTANGSDVQVPSTPAQDRCSTEPATEKPASSSAPAATLTGGQQDGTQGFGIQPMQAANKLPARIASTSAEPPTADSTAGRAGEAAVSQHVADQTGDKGSADDSGHSAEEAESRADRDGDHPGPSDSDGAISGNVCEPFPAWMPGRVLEISGGAAQVQGVLDSMQQPLAVINWHAAWCQPCQALVPALDRLAGQHPQVAFLQLDVVSTPENRALALEKVVVRRDSRRQGSYMRPQLKSANKFPCLSVHQPPSLQMIELCEGEPALGAVCVHLEQLPALTHVQREQLEQQRQHAEHSRPAAPAAVQSEDTSTSATQPATLTSLAGSRPDQPSASSHQHSTQGSVPAGADQCSQAVHEGAAGAASPAGVQARKGDIRLLKRGAADLKDILGRARAAGQLVVVLWTQHDSEAGAACTVLRRVVQGLAGLYPGVRFWEGDVDTSAANQALARSLGVKCFPTCHVYRDVKLVRAVEGLDPAKLQAAIANAQSVAGGVTTPAASTLAAAGAVGSRGKAPSGDNRAATASAESSPTQTPHTQRALQGSGTGSKAGPGSAAASPSVATNRDSQAQSQAQPAGQSASPPSSTTSSSAAQGGPGKGKKALRPATDGLPGIYDPPVGKLNKAGATRRYPGNQVGHYWPKMPCLHCGCPWWLGEDWDARCARCTWTCENDGYDDDSNPLPKFAKTWAAFTAVIQSGRTPDWNPGN